MSRLLERYICAMDHPLRKFRAELGLSLRAMARETGTSASALSRIERRQQDADLDLLRQLSALAARRAVKFPLADIIALPPVREDAA
jgi:transcriptional regulator with XRE-family HTH domain